jgi:hypothetical protein
MSPPKQTNKVQKTLGGKKAAALQKKEDNKEEYKGDVKEEKLKECEEA